MDKRVQEVQVWLGETYPNYFKYDADGIHSGKYPIKPDGITGNATVKALVMALQIHANLTPVDGIWGNATSGAYPVVNESSDSTVIKIIQGGFLCKGYNPGPFDGEFGDLTRKAILELSENLGFPDNDKLTSDFIKSLLTTDPTVLIETGRQKIREVQQYLNKNYSALFKAKLSFLPTGGVFERKTSTALIYAIQKELGTTADGMLGDKTFALFPEIEMGCTKKPIVRLLKAALICNGYELDFFDTYDATTAMKVEHFQKFMRLDLDPKVILGKVNRRTWGALLWSKGDKDRTHNACDCRYRISDPELAETLFSLGFRYIGRYLTNVEPGGYDKKMTPEEVQILLNAGLSIFPIFQESPRSVVLPSDFTVYRGREDAEKAFLAALHLGFKKGTTIYFALDCDMMENDIKNHAIPYFQGIDEILKKHNHYYQIGVYGARNSCTKVCASGYATNCFVSNMSTGYSGNLGYVMPKNWAFEQFHEQKKFTCVGHEFDLDHDMASGVDAGADSVDVPGYIYNYQPPYIPTAEDIAKATPICELIPAIRWLEEQYYNHTGLLVDKVACRIAVLDYLFQYQYTTYDWDFISPQNGEFIRYINDNFPEHEYVKQLHPYIYAHEEGEDNDKIVTRAKLVTDGSLGLFELPHLAVVIKCYLYSRVPGSWSAWAGDYATAIKEVYANMGEHTEAYVPFAMERIGAMEKDTVNVLEARQFNYCDLISDIDGYQIHNLIYSSHSKYALSECLQEYYTNKDLYNNRYQFWQPCIGFQEWNISSIRDAIISGLELPVILLFAPHMGDYPGSKEAAATVFALNILYWAGHAPS